MAPNSWLCTWLNILEHKSSQIDGHKMALVTAKARQWILQPLLLTCCCDTLPLGRLSRLRAWGRHELMSPCFLAVVRATAKWTTIPTHFLFVQKEDIGSSFVLPNTGIVEAPFKRLVPSMTCPFLSIFFGFVKWAKNIFNSLVNWTRVTKCTWQNNKVHGAGGARKKETH